ncbi:LuxR C-terminal-related transcriptional regulator [Arthrobacter sp. GMC3]|uniref:LuxR C-terminal-related transcriptional regulator n=1 Tax=Arthrobacter sp. GMC3 TaxID=2058894 RepID=UPI000CE37971|nr:LuxR C-terminal-related transcriptional regulator [Arthrobacter sp. GMC3]
MATVVLRPGLRHLIDRPALCLELDKAFERRLTLVVAQAGAGKSTLLKQWSARHGERDFAFIDVESADDNPSHFIRRLLDGLKMAMPAAVGLTRAENFRDQGFNNPGLASLSSALDSIPEVVIVVDDAQRLSNVRLVADLGTLVERTRGNVHLVMSSRADPPIALSRYRLNDDLLEIRQQDLAFNEGEASELLERIIGHPLTGNNVRALLERTEGWAAGLQLAGLNLRNERDPDTFIAEFGGSDRLVADYLGEEVLSDLPAGQRELLLQMSVLDDMCAGLVEAVAGFDGTEHILDQLLHDSMFLVQLDTRREWFRFHHLFRELLRSRLRAESAGAEHRILGAAAEWHLLRGKAKSAVEYLLRAQLWDRALEAILSHAMDIVANGDMLTVVRWMLRIPESVRSERVNDALLTELLRSVNERALETEFAAPPTSVDPVSSASTVSKGLGFFAAQLLLTARPEISATAAWRQLGELETNSRSNLADTSTELAVSGLDETHRQRLIVAGGRASFLAGEMVEARGLLTRILAEVAVNSLEHVGALSTLSLLEAWSGNVEPAEALIYQALLAASEAGLLSDPAVADAYLASVLTALIRGGAGLLAEAETPDFHAPDGHVQQTESNALVESAVSSSKLKGLEGAPQGPTAERDPVSAVQHHILLARVAASNNQPDQANRHLTEAVKMAEIHGFVGVFVRAGPTILAGLKSITGPQAAFRDVILARAQQLPGTSQRASIPEPLTDRELEILSYLPTRFTNEELAARLFVSVNTIKTHIVHIYRKLDATNRDVAISKARILGLL